MFGVVTLLFRTVSSKQLSRYPFTILLNFYLLEVLYTQCELAFLNMTSYNGLKNRLCVIKNLMVLVADWAAYDDDDDGPLVSLA